MNLFDLSATALLVWGVVLHLIADWPLQNDWMANNKAGRRKGPRVRLRSGWFGSYWFDRNPAAFVHAGIHGALLAIIFGWVAIPLALAHLIIDTRAPVVWWSNLIGQTQPQGNLVRAYFPRADDSGTAPLYDVGLEVRFWTDQVFHIACIAVAAILVTL